MIIIVVGVTLKDLESVGTIIYDKINYEQSDYTEYDKIPISLEKWPKKMNVKCWNCRKLFITRPVPIPIRCDKSIVNKGVACDMSCAKTYILTYKDPDINQKEIKKHIQLLIRACQELDFDVSLMGTKDHFYLEEGFGY